MILLLPPPNGSIGHESQWAGTGRTIKLSPSSSSFVVDPPRGLRGVSGGSGGGGDGRRRWGTHSQAEGRTSERATTVHYTLSERGESWGGVDGEGNRLFFLTRAPRSVERERKREREQQPRLDRPTKSSRRTTTASPLPRSLVFARLEASFLPSLSVVFMRAKKKGGEGVECARARVRGEKLVAEGTSSFYSSYQVELSSLSSQRN